MHAQSLAFVEELFADYLRDPASVPADWRSHFDHQSANLDPLNVVPVETRPAQVPTPSTHAPSNGDLAVLQHRVDELIRNYRVRGHIAAQLDPLGQTHPAPPEIELAHVGIQESDLDKHVSFGRGSSATKQTVREILRRMRSTYCRYIGVQFMHIDDLTVRDWLQARMESGENRVDLPRDAQLRILTRLTDAVIFEEFLQKKYTGAKSFSLEGAETLIPLLELAIERASELGAEEIVMGMPHRGRLNVLANILGKSAQQIFREFEDLDPAAYMGGGDVKYHLGHTNRRYHTASGRTLQVGMAFNPSHLEFVNPLVLGRARAKQDRNGDTKHDRLMTILMHGDAAFAGEGVVQETLNLSQLAPYATGGTLHIVVNNQIGFTTTPEEDRSCFYATDVAKMLQIPIFHVNGEHPEAVAQVVHLALDFRAKFHRDVVIDMYCYRRRGHNEGDEPSFTQPLLYKTIAKRKPVRDGYLEHLLSLGGVTQAEADRIAEQRRMILEEALSEARSEDYRRPNEVPTGVWEGYYGGPEREADETHTGLDQERASKLIQRLTALPEGFRLHPKLERFQSGRKEMALGKRPLDWAAAEALAFASIATEGFTLRLTGQDSERGTFSQRHSVLHDVETGRKYSPLEHVADGQAPVLIANSPLSEIAVLGFEFGYSLGCPDGLIAWEAQFGDFVNAAQVVIDQFITSAEDKWHQWTGLTLLLPHGFEGQGPEHSSARLERFLGLAAEDNLQIVQPTTPAQYFHVLRRQVLRPWRKPLIVFTPKSLLRLPECVSTLADIASPGFQRVLGDPSLTPGTPVDRVLLCNGKVYYDLVKQRTQLGRKDVAIVRVEQLYPFPATALRSALAQFADGTPAVWVQDEPSNMGAWPYLHARIGSHVFGRLPLHLASRVESASPATGSHNAHKIEQDQLLTHAFGGL